MTHLNREYLVIVENPDDSHLYGWYMEAAIALINKTAIAQNQHEDIHDDVMQAVIEFGKKDRNNLTKNYGNYGYLRKIVQRSIGHVLGSNRGMTEKEYTLFLQMQQLSDARSIPWDEEYAHIYARCLGAPISAIYEILQSPGTIELIDNEEFLDTAKPIW